jgi:hypothetical protein
MNKIILIYIALSYSAVNLLLGQSLYVPLEFQEAYENNTRSLDGKPGQDYWQNKSDYIITARLNTETGLLSGSAKITYYNQSPDTLDRIVLRLYPNIYKSNSVRDFPLRANKSHEGMIINTLTVNSKNYNLTDETLLVFTSTNLTIKDLYILPGKKTYINISWEFIVPKEIGIRMGQYDSTSFFIAYWYPQIAVYDDIDGWDMTEYTGAAEFYNDFNNYDVKITVPNNFGVWATGELNNPQDVLTSEILKRYNNALESEETINIIKLEDYTSHAHLYNNTNETNTWNFIANNINDFSFAVSAMHLWDAKTVKYVNDKVFINSVYKSDMMTMYESCDIADKAIDLLTKELPGVKFPFPKLTVFNGSGGMEYPMMINMSGSEERIWTVYTLVHEIIHMYFPFYMGINERKYAWMDEGITQMLSEYVQYEIDKSIDFRERNVKRYLEYAGQFDDIPMMVPSYLLRGDPYRNTSYFRPANAFNMMKDFMSEPIFKKAIQEFIKRWNGKHPTPYDLFFTLEDVTDDDLNWFLEPWFFKSGYPDLSIDTAFVKDNVLKIQINKEGELPIPAAVTIKFKDGTTKKVYRTASAWKNEDDDFIWIETEIDKKPLQIILGNNYIPDTDLSNNIWNFK